MLENNSNYDNIKQYLADKLRGIKTVQGQIEYDDIKHIEECITQACRDEIDKNGVCGCNLYRRK